MKLHRRPEQLPRRLSRLAPPVLLLLLAPAAQGAELLVTVRDTAGRALSEAVVFAEPVGVLPPEPAAAPRAVIDQVNKEFVPLVSIVRTGTEVSFPNSDNIRHSIYSFSPAKRFNIALYSGRKAPPVVFDQSGLVVLGCNIHDTMVAWLVVVDTPYFGRTDSAGTVRLTQMPAGLYHLKAWYPVSKFEPVSR
jgi:plastocyanin